MVFSFFFRWQRDRLLRDLTKNGLVMEDLLRVNNQDVSKAIAQLSPWQQQMRLRRMRRAQDLSAKRTTEAQLPLDIQAKHNPSERIGLYELYVKNRQQRLEREMYN